MKSLCLGDIDNIILMGGSPLLAEFAISLKNSKKYSVTVFTCSRQLKEVIGKGNETLEYVLKKNNIVFYCPKDICKDKRFQAFSTKTTLAIGIGEVWTFDSNTIRKFQGRLLDFMGIPLPRYRGGAHYSWMILKNDRCGACNLQLINEDMVQGVFDSGEIVLSKKYRFPPGAKIPQDYFDFAVKTELDFLKGFLRQSENGRIFKLKKLDESLSMYFPRLYTLKHGFINWNWGTDDIAAFISAFDDPYKGASSFVNGKRIFLKDCYSSKNDGTFHPFQAGLIYKTQPGSIFVATADGSLIIKKAVDESGNNILPAFRVGQRLFTPEDKLRESMCFSAEYNNEGII